MIHGIVNARHEAVLSLRIRGPSGTEFVVDAAIDTGATPALTLPTATIAALNLTFQIAQQAKLADGTVVTIDMYNAEIEWDGAWLAVLICEVDSASLLGTALLAGHEVFIEFNPAVLWKSDGYREFTSQCSRAAALPPMGCTRFATAGRLYCGIQPRNGTPCSLREALTNESDQHR